VAIEKENEMPLQRTVTKPLPAEFAALVAKAEAAGQAALVAATPTPMIVGEAVDLFSDKIDYAKPTYYVAEGACGFAWVWFKGNTPFGRAMKAAGKASEGYPTGLQVWVSEGGQSIARKEAYARAYATVLKEAGITAYAQSRLD
jgi:hypothetical protein